MLARHQRADDVAGAVAQGLDVFPTVAALVEDQHDLAFPLGVEDMKARGQCIRKTAKGRRIRLVSGIRMVQDGQVVIRCREQCKTDNAQ